MLRLRTTTGLSLLALAIGVAGTGWLSTLTAVWPGPPARFAAAARAVPAPRTLPPPRRAHAALRVVPAVRRTPVVSDSSEAQARVPAPPPELVPLAMPSDTSQSWDELRGHLDGRVLLHVEVDASGRVSAASVAESSGDPILDTHALRSVRGWRFAVPPDRPDGFSGELPMRFSSRGDGIAKLP
ncbi:MAG: energy transducer TonB [Xanthomonadaceae bacterium]|nr:energy transducer TonB [Xanthomonadaceae bacterium]